MADTTVFVAQESGRELGELPEEIAVSVITAAELELGVLRAADTETRATRLATLSRVRATYPLLSVDAEVGSWAAGGACAVTTPGSRPPRCATASPSSLKTLTSPRSPR